MDLHVYALLKRRYNELAEYVSTLSEEAKEVTEEASEVMKDVEGKLNEAEVILTKINETNDSSVSLLSKLEEVLEEVEPSVEELKEFMKDTSNFLHLGEYNSELNYHKGNEVLYNGSTYRALEDVINEEPSKSPKWQLIALRGVDGKGSVSSVNDISPDENGNVNLGKITADWEDLEGKPSVLTELSEEDDVLHYKGEPVNKSVSIGLDVYESSGDEVRYTVSEDFPVGENRLLVFVGGALQVPGSGFTEVEGGVEFSEAPLKGLQIVIYNIKG